MQGPGQPCKGVLYLFALLQARRHDDCDVSSARQRGALHQTAPYHYMTKAFMCCLIKKGSHIATNWSRSDALNTSLRLGILVRAALVPLHWPQTPLTASATCFEAAGCRSRDASGSQLEAESLARSSEGSNWVVLVDVFCELCVFAVCTRVYLHSNRPCEQARGALGTVGGRVFRGTWRRACTLLLPK